MAQLVYSTLNSGYSSTQAYLGSVLTCPSCKGQKPKALFKVVDGESICKDCQDELEQEAKE
jgi:hypothetical protein